MIDPKTSAIIDDLRNVGNAAAHSSEDLRESDARRYKKLTEDVLTRLNILF